MIKNRVPISKELYDEIYDDLLDALLKYNDRMSLNDLTTLTVNLLAAIIEITVNAVDMKESKELIRAAATQNAINTLKEIMDAKTRRNLR